VVKDEERVAAAPVMFEGAVPEAEPPGEMLAKRMRLAPPAPAPAAFGAGISAKSMAQTVESVAAGQALGELFQYNVAVPVSVGRGQSAMAPIVSSTLGPRKDLIYNEAKMAGHPVATLHFKNSTGLTLERGPVTVLENGDYVGEAVLPFTVDTAEAVVSYAVELGVHIKPDFRTVNQLHALNFKDGYLLQQYYEVRHTTYRLDNRTAQPKTVLLEHDTRSGYDIFDTPAPAEQTLTTHRYRVEAAPGLSNFVVKERCLLIQRDSLQNLSARDLQKYLADKFLDESTFARLKELLDTFAAIEKLKADITAQESQRAAIYRSQEQAQKNMQVLAPSGEEGRLRGRYVQQLAQSEEELAQIARTLAQLADNIKQLGEKAQQIMAKLPAA
jgi:hypothetical protein